MRLALVAAMQVLPARQRAVLLLREVQDRAQRRRGAQDEQGLDMRATTALADQAWGGQALG